MNSIILYTIVIFLLLFFMNQGPFHYSPADQSNFSDHHLHHHLQTIPIVGAVGPESFAFDRFGDGPYTGVSDGRIIKWSGNERRWLDFAVTSIHRKGCKAGPQDDDETEHICGRPLGLRFNKRSGDLYISDAYMGLLVVGPNGGFPTKLASQTTDGLSFGFTNGLDIDPHTGVVYFTDSSSIYQRRNYVSVILSSDTTGRLLKYDPKTKQTNVLLSNLSFPNGVALSKDEKFILVAETTNCRILRYWLDQTTKRGTYEIFANLPGFPDNIKRNEKGEFWIGLHSRRTKLAKMVLTHPWIGKMLNDLVPINVINKIMYVMEKWRGGGLAMKLSEEGEVMQVLENKSSKWMMSISEVEEKDERLWIGSVNSPYALIISNYTRN